MVERIEEILKKSLGTTSVLSKDNPILIEIAKLVQKFADLNGDLCIGADLIMCDNNDFKLEYLTDLEGEPIQIIYNPACEHGERCQIHTFGKEDFFIGAEMMKYLNNTNIPTVLFSDLYTDEAEEIASRREGHYSYRCPLSPEQQNKAYEHGLTKVPEVFIDSHLVHQ